MGRRRALRVGSRHCVVGACGDDDSERRRLGSSSGGKKNYKMTLIAGVKGDEFYITMNCGAQAEAKKLGVTLDFQGPDQFDATLQTPIVNGVAAKKPDAMLIAPTDSKAMYVPIKQVADAGIKIVLVDTTLEQADLAVSQIASDNEGGGQRGGQGAGRADRRQGQGLRQSTSSRASRPPTSARQGLRGGGQEARPRLPRRDYNQDQPDKAAAIMKAQLAKNPDLKGIFATNLFGAEGAASRSARGRQAGR